jgi:hypothetical protein
MWLSSHHETPPVIPDSFLDRSAPRLRTFTLDGIPFPGLPKLLLSSNHLVRLWLSNIPRSWYISPEAMGTLLSALSSLRMLSLQFQSPQPRPDAEGQSLPPPKRSVLPALDKIRFKGVNISCRKSDWQLSSIEQVCNSSLHPLSTVEDLYIDHRYSKLVWRNDAIENSLWLEFLLPFTVVKNLYLSKEFATDIATALQELVGDRITEVLPSLQNIFVEGLEPLASFQEKLGQFLAARQLSDQPITISVWDKDSYMKPM